MNINSMQMHPLDINLNTINAQTKPQYLAADSLEVRIWDSTKTYISRLFLIQVSL